MKTRVISALVGLLILAAVLAILNTVVFNVVIGALGIMAVYEFLGAVNCLKHKSLSALALIMAIAIPFAQEPAVRTHIPQIMFAAIVALFIIILKKHSNLRVETAFMVFFLSIFVPLFFSSAVYMRNSFGPRPGGLYLLWALGAAWLSDTGAYFAGRAFGKRKLAPVISPKKTVEGAIGGVITSTVVMMPIALVYQIVMQIFFTPIAVNYLFIILLTPVFSVIGILGDLSASVIKRQFGVKDYGHIMPGHGGIMDRFDSALFTIPAVFIVAQFVGVIV